MSLVADPDLPEIRGLVIVLLGLWLLFVARLLEMPNRQSRRVFFAFRRLYSRWNARPARIARLNSYVLLTGYALVLSGSLWFILSFGHWGSSIHKSSPGNNPLVTISVDSRPPASPPTNYSSAILNVALLVVGGALLARGALSRKFVTACTGSFMLLTGLTSTIKNDFKLDKIFGIEKVEINPATVHQQTAHLVFDSLGGVGRFSPGCADYSGRTCKLPQSLSYTLGADTSHDPNELFDAICKREGTLFIVGHTDRVPLSRNPHRQFESNIGLAQGRAESVKQAILDFSDIPLHKCPKRPALFTQVGGPANTPEVSSDATQLSYEPDRSVAIIWFHDAASGESGDGSSTPVSSGGGWLRTLVVLGMLLVLAIFMAKGATKLSVKYDVAKQVVAVEKSDKSA